MEFNFDTFGTEDTGPVNPAQKPTNIGFDFSKFGQEVIPNQTAVKDAQSGQKYGALLPYDTEGGRTVGGAVGESFKIPLNLVSSAFNSAKDIGSSLVNLLNPNMDQNTGANILRFGVGALQYLAKNVPDKDKDQKAKQVFDSFTKAFGERHGSIEGWKDILHGDFSSRAATETFDALTRTAVNDPFGFGLEIYSVARGTAGIVGKAQELGGLKNTAVPAFEQGASNLAQNAVIKPAQTLSKLFNKARNVALGATTGVGSGAIEEISQNPESARAGFRGQVSPQELVQKAEDAFQAIKNKRSLDYKSKLTDIKGTGQMVQIQPLVDKFNKLLEQFGVSIGDDGTLDFRDSSLANTSEATSDIKSAFDSVKRLQEIAKDGKVPAVRLDAFKQQLDGLYSAKGGARAFIQGLKSDTKNLLTTSVKGYSEMVKGYEETSNLIDDMKNLSLGGSAGADTILKKLTSIFRSNQEFRLEFVKQLAEQGNKNLIPEIAGYNMKEFIPQGLSKVIVTGTGLATWTIRPEALIRYALSLPVSSPRIVAEFFNAMGVAKKFIAPLTDAVSKANKALGPVVSSQTPTFTTLGQVNKNK